MPGVSSEMDPTNLLPTMGNVLSCNSIACVLFKKICRLRKEQGSILFTLVRPRTAREYLGLPLVRAWLCRNGRRDWVDTTRNKAIRSQTYSAWAFPLKRVWLYQARPEIKPTRSAMLNKISLRKISMFLTKECRRNSGRNSGEDIDQKICAAATMYTNMK